MTATLSETTTVTRQVNRLSAKQLYYLCERMKVDYVSSKLDDKAYAAMLTAEPGFPFTVAKFSISTARGMLDLQANTITIAEERKAERLAKAAEKPGCDHTLILDEIHSLQSMIAALSKQVHVLGARL